MRAPCVRVPVSEGEDTRTRLAEDDLLDQSLRIEGEEGWLYLPVVDADAVPDDLDVVERDVAERETQTMPADILGFDPSYERLGDIVIVDEDDRTRAEEIADAVMESAIRAETVVNRASKVKGETRVRDWDVLAGDGTVTIHREYGYEFELDIAEVYFSPRLATERNRVVEQVEAGEHALDMFAGVGPYAVPMADRGAEVVAADINEVAIDYLLRNAERNGVPACRVGEAWPESAAEADENGDEGQDETTGCITAAAGDVRELTDDYTDWADRLVMNLPHSADEFLDTAVAFAGDECVLHYYDIQHEEDPFGPGIESIEAAAGDEYDVVVETEHTVRSYAPHELNVVLDVRLIRT
ncbi:class I SAM-dependent methyltransferase [Halospeciosus flavus]|uniref:Class I SAM-dependent methyltransferase n=1 Tax=Halospeciosus flavus TaxID=3032283 RepID=A0ABD5Z2E3_9EURY|nr:class I SAM-dependent methyltransferase family protein [Halospeciosus flavus]